MVKKTINFDVNTLMAMNGNWLISANNVVKEYIHYANETNSWCLEDQASFEDELDIANPDYQAFVQFLKENGYAGLSDSELGTLWVIKCGISDELVNIGSADKFGKVPTNSFVQLIIEHERKQIKVARRNQLKAANAKREKRGPKFNFYRPVYDKYVSQMLPWLRTVSSIENDKSALTLIGFVLFLSGHYELKGQYLEITPAVKKVLKEEVGKRTIKNKYLYVSISFADYLWNRMKKVYYDSLKLSA